MIWWYLIAIVVSVVLSSALMKQNAQKPASIDEFEAPTADENRSIPVLFGTSDIEDPNVVWYGDLATKNIKKSSMFSSTTVGYRYYLAFHSFFCYGPCDRITRIAWDGKEVWTGNLEGNGEVGVDHPNLFGDNKTGEGGVFGKFQFCFGEPDQEPNAYLVSQVGTLPAFRGLLSAVWVRGAVSSPTGPFGSNVNVDHGYVGNSKYLKFVSVRPTRILKGWQGSVWYPEKASIDGVHMNAAHIIYEAMTNSQWGMGTPTSNFNDAVWRACADTFHSEGMGLSLKWNQQTTIEQFIQTVLNHCAANLVLNHATKQYELIPFRGDYDIEDLETFGPDDIEQMTAFDRQGWGETVNEITLGYTDPSTGKLTSITQQDLGNIQAQQKRIPKYVELKGIRNTELAKKCLSRELIGVSTPLAKGKFTINQRGANIKYGRRFRLDWPERDVEGMPVVCNGIRKSPIDDNFIEIEWSEDVFALGAYDNLSSIVEGAIPSPPDVPAEPPNKGAAVIGIRTEPPALEDLHDGDRFLVDDEDAEDLFAGHEGQVAEWDSATGEFIFIDVPNGTIIFLEDENRHVTVNERIISSSTPWTPEVSLLTAEQNPPDGAYLPVLMPDGLYKKLALSTVRAGSIKAVDVEFDDSFAGLEVENVQDAIDALAQPDTNNAIRVKAFASNGTTARFYGETLAGDRFDSSDSLNWVERENEPLPYSFEELMFVESSHNKYFAKFGAQIGRSVGTDIFGEWLYTNGVWPTPIRGHGAVQPGSKLKLRYFDNATHANTFVVFFGDYIFKSTNGTVTWSEVGTPIGLKYDGDRFRSAIQEIYWDETEERYIVFAVDTQANGFDAVGTEVKAFRPHIYLSDDLITFTLHQRLYFYPPDSADDGITYPEMNCARNGDFMVTCGEFIQLISGGGSSLRPFYAFSDDAGATWTYGVDLDIDWPEPFHGLSGVIYDGEKFVISGYGFTGISENLEEWEFSDDDPTVSGISETNQFIQKNFFADGSGRSAAVSFETRPNGVRGLTGTKTSTDGLIWTESPGLPRVAANEVSFDDSRTGMGAVEVQQALETLKWQLFKQNETVPDEYIFDFYSGDIHEITITEDTSVKFSHGTTARVSRGTLIIRQDDIGGHTIIWDVGVVWSGGTPPPYSKLENAVNVFEFFTVDGGATVYARMIYRNVYNDAGTPPAYPSQDALWPHTVFLLHMNTDIEGSQEIIDARGHEVIVVDDFESPGADPFNPVLPKVELTLLEKKFGTASLSLGPDPESYEYPPGSGNHNALVNASNPAHIIIESEGANSLTDISEGDWTLEGWIQVKAYEYPFGSGTGVAYGSAVIFQMTTPGEGGISVSIGAFGGWIPHVVCSTVSGVTLDSDFGDISLFAIGHDAGQSFVDFEFRHFAICRQGETIWVCCGGRAMQCKAGYLGVPIGKIPGVENADIKIGEFGRIYMDELRLIKGIARYTSRFYSPPTGPFSNPASFTPPTDNRNEWTLSEEEGPLIARGGGWSNGNNPVSVSAADDLSIRILDEGEIIGVTILTRGGDGSLQLDIKKGNYSTYPSSDSICGGNKPTIISDNKFSDTTLTDWDRTVTPGDFLVLKLESSSTFTRIDVTIHIQKSA